MPNGNPTSIRVGAGLLRIAPVGAIEPTDLTAVWDAAWLQLGYTEEGSTFAYQLSSEAIEVAEELDPIRNETTGRTISVAFSLAEITATNVARAMNGGTMVVGAGAGSQLRLIGSATIVATTGVFTTSTPHLLAINDPVVLGAIVTTTGVVAGTVYYVKTMPIGTTFTLSATPGGTALSLTGDGSTASVSEILSRIVTFEPPAIGTETRVALGWEAFDKSERWVFRKCFQTGSVETARKKAPDKSLLPVEFSLETVTGIAPFKAIIDSALPTT
jgi:hypothetical protein